tara:strand:- start:252 stop:1127 length:876 start_codon:yes stop_codon:yes gene_type:complete
VSTENISRSLVFFAKDIKISHSIFALPFAAAGVLLSNIKGYSFFELFLLLLCMISARSFAMGINRIVDRKIDKKNDRTKTRQIPMLKLQTWQASFWVSLSALIFCSASFAFNFETGVLSVLVLFILGFYSWWKRFSWACHFYLGFCLGLSPIAAEIALSHELSFVVFLLGLSICLWTAGFDIIYAIQDLEFDRKHGLYSIPARFGVQKSILISRILFLAMILFLLTIGIIKANSFIYFFGVGIISLILVYQHILVRKISKDNCQKQINKAFFDVNSWVSVIYFFTLILDKI